MSDAPLKMARKSFPADLLPALAWILHDRQDIETLLNLQCVNLAAYKAVSTVLYRVVRIKSDKGWISLLAAFRDDDVEENRIRIGKKRELNGEPEQEKKLHMDMEGNLGEKEGTEQQGEDAETVGQHGRLVQQGHNLSSSMERTIWTAQLVQHIVIEALPTRTHIQEIIDLTRNTFALRRRGSPPYLDPAPLYPNASKVSITQSVFGTDGSSIDYKDSEDSDSEDTSHEPQLTSIFHNDNAFFFSIFAPIHLCVRFDSSLDPETNQAKDRFLKDIFISLGCVKDSVRTASVHGLLRVATPLLASPPATRIFIPHASHGSDYVSLSLLTERLKKYNVDWQSHVILALALRRGSLQRTGHSTRTTLEICGSPELRGSCPTLRTVVTGVEAHAAATLIKEVCDTIRFLYSVDRSLQEDLSKIVIEVDQYGVDR
nr:uncharacterized protein CI109_001725 [Kwoniella shandongensis]KAA5529786.1 hypothetical protein CI109_001725 [Kwoniella shandongensis]